MDSLTILLTSLLAAVGVGLLRHAGRAGPRARRRVADAQFKGRKIAANTPVARPTPSSGRRAA